MSIWHWNVDPDSLDVNVRVGVVSLVELPSAGDVIVVFGGVVSTVNVRVVGAGFGNDDVTARTENVYVPSASPL